MDLYIATLITAKAVIPAPIFNGVNFQQESRKILALKTSFCASLLPFYFIFIRPGSQRLIAGMNMKRGIVISSI